MEREHPLVAHLIYRKPLGRLMKVDKRASSFGGNDTHGTFDHGATVTASGTKNVPQYAMRMHADQYGLVPSQIAPNQCNVRFASLDFAFVSDYAKLAFRGSDHGLTHSMHITFVLHPVSNQLGNREHLEAVSLTELGQVGDPGHGSVVAHDFADHAGRDKSSHAGEID